MPQFDSGWQSWLNDNIKRGCSPESMISAMVGAGIDAATATFKVAQALAPDVPLPVQPPAPAFIPAFSAAGRAVNPYQYDAMPIAAGNRIDVGDRFVNVVLRSERPQIVVFNNVLSHEECDELIERSRDKLKRSTTVNPITGEHDVIANRTSEGTFFDRCEDEFITRIDNRVATLMNWPLTHGEGLQILHYGVGGEYRPHFDYFPPHEVGSTTHVAVGGQRVSTMIMYLSDVEAGGETIFPDAGISVTPQKGSAVYFRYCNANGQIDPMTLHGGAPVQAGEKWIMTKWMRQRPYG
ncbi:2OG-Fe(II) oxygenase [Uliginosibacterium sp. H3]|uniref:2OG-Fe(II) oxygenase n=1 Tax=Uliginosibacterium silvisoli TaxID=3114758 RepID=A0ABU6K060_9RHOO|nr:2OG-Fe(II) oxygenase [Uliginosibacterium sp. H3]